MSTYFVTGKKGGGKGLYAVIKAEEYLKAGRIVASNFDFFLDRHPHVMNRNLLLELFFPSPLGVQSRTSYIRLPDKPTIDDFNYLPIGNPTIGTDFYVEEENGLLILDELASWFNARSWNDKTRAAILEHFLYLRKLGWDVLLLVQDISMVDKQLIGSSGEFLVVCRCLSKVPIPFIGKFMRLFGIRLLLPSFHRASIYLGENESSLKVDSLNYKRKDLFKFYDTLQIFSSSYPHGVHSLLSNWHTKGRHLPSPRLSRANVLLIATVGVVFGVLLTSFFKNPIKPAVPLPSSVLALPAGYKVHETVFVVGIFSDGVYQKVQLSNGLSAVLTKTHNDNGDLIYQVGKTYFKAK